MRKIFALILAAMMLLALCACGGKNPDPSNGGTPDPGSTQQGNSNNDKPGAYTQKMMEDTIVSYFSGVSELKSLSLCSGSSIEYEAADIPWQTVDIWTINDPAVGYDELAAAMSSQLTAAGFTEKETDIGGYEWSVSVGDKAMRIELRPESWGEGSYIIYATPEAE